MFKPILDYVLIEPEAKEEKLTALGLILPGTRHEERPVYGVIRAVGDGKRTEWGKTIPLSRKVGEQVVFKKYSQQTFRENDTMYYMVKEADIIAVLQ